VILFLSKNPEYENMKYAYGGQPYYMKRRRCDILSILGFLLMAAAIAACIALVVLPSYFLYCLISLENQNAAVMPTPKPKPPIMIIQN
jgi:hypothetical protein